MGKTRTIKNKHAEPSKKKAKKAGDGGVKKTKDRAGSKSKAKVPAIEVKGKPNLGQDKKKQKRVYSEKELGIPQLNTVTPVGVTKPKGKKKGKVFVDDRESMNTILAMVEAEKQGQIESKIMRARQLEEIREARRIEAEKKEAERKALLENTKEQLRKKRKKNKKGGDQKSSEDEGPSLKELTSTGSKAVKSKKKKKVSFATPE